MLIITPGKLLKALNDTFFDNETLSKIVPKAVTRNLGVEIVHSKSALWSKNVAKAVNLVKSPG